MLNKDSQTYNISHQCQNLPATSQHCVAMETGSGISLYFSDVRDMLMSLVEQWILNTGQEMYIGEISWKMDHNGSLRSYVFEIHDSILKTAIFNDLFIAFRCNLRIIRETDL